MKYVSSMFGMGCLTALGITAIVMNLNHSLLQLIIGGVIGMVGTTVGINVGRGEK